MKNIFVLTFLILSSCTSNVRSENLDTFDMYVDSYTTNKKHSTLYYQIVDVSNPLINNSKPTEKSRLGSYPYYVSVSRTIDQVFKAHRYKSLSIKSKSERDEYTNVLFPVYISFLCYNDPNKALSMFQLGVSEYNIPNQKSDPLKFIEGIEFLANNQKFNFTDNLSKVWTILLGVENEIPQNNELLLNSMIKCASPYFNKNFKGTVTCKR